MTRLRFPAAALALCLALSAWASRAAAQCWSLDEVTRAFNTALTSHTDLVASLQSDGYELEIVELEATDSVAYEFVHRFTKGKHVVSLYSDTAGATVGLLSVSDMSRCTDEALAAAVKQRKLYKRREAVLTRLWYGSSFKTPEGHTLTTLQQNEADMFAIRLWKR